MRSLLTSRDSHKSAPPSTYCHPERSEGSAVVMVNTIQDEKRYYVYMVASRSLNLYTGVTGNLYGRILQHKKGEVEGFTKRYHVNRLVYYEPFKYVDNAIVRAKQIKSWTRAKRLALIKSLNPTWQDLADGWGEPVKLQIPRSQNKRVEECLFSIPVARDDNPKSEDVDKKAGVSEKGTDRQNSSRSTA
jgi:putative endonuclease